MVQAITRKRDWRDLDLNFSRHPATGDVSKLSGEDAIKRSIRNLVLTHFYERKFQHGIGSNATKLLFENINPLTATFLESAIKETIENYEPRGIVLGVKVVQRPDDNKYEAGVAFKVNNRPEPILINFFLERIR